MLQTKVWDKYYIAVAEVYTYKNPFLIFVTSVNKFFVVLAVLHFEQQYRFSFVGTPRKFIITTLSICKFGSQRRSELTDRKLCSSKFMWCFRTTKLIIHLCIPNAVMISPA